MSLPDQTTLSHTPRTRDVLSPGAGRVRGWFTAGNWMPALALVIAAIAPLLVIGPLVTHGGVYSNWGDVAANELSVQNAVHLHQAVGPYDRFGWFHPGPMLFYLLAVPYALMDWNGAGLEVGTALINLAAAVGIVALVARRAGGKAALGTAAIVCAFEFALGPTHITNPWGPEVIVVPAALFFVLSADLAAGAVWSLVGAVAVGSFLLQTEIGTAPAVVVGAFLAVAVRIVDWLVHGTIRPSLRNSMPAGLVALGVGAVIWAPPIWQQLTNNPGNLGVVANYFLHHRGHHSRAVAISALAGGIFDPLPRLINNRSTLHPSGAGLALFLVGAGVLALVCWWRRQWFACALAGGMIPIAIVCLVSFQRVEGPILSYLVMWTSALAACGGIALVLFFTTPARPLPALPPWGDRARLLGALLLAGCAVVSGVRLSDSSARVKAGAGYVIVTSATDEVERLLPHQAQRVLVCVMSTAAWPTSVGVVADLRKNGRDARVNPFWLFVFGKELAPTSREQAAVFLDSVSSAPRPLPVKPEGSASSGGLTIRVFEPPHGYLSAAVCPPVS